MLRDTLYKLDWRESNLCVHRGFKAVLQVLADSAAEVLVPGPGSTMQHGSEVLWSGPHSTSIIQWPFWSHIRTQSRPQQHHRATHWPSRAAASFRTDREERLHNGSASSNGLEQELQKVRGGQASTSGMQHMAVLRATKSAAIPLRERERPLAAYMTLPASQYSVLDAKQIERIDDSTFRCYVGGLRFLGFTVDPVLTVSVIVTDKGPTVRLLSTELEGSPAVEAANDRFSATMENEVRWGSSAEPGFLELRSDTSIQVALEVPGWFRLVPVEAIEKTGSGVMQRILNRMVPRFLKQLQADYELWASGDESRKPIAAGELSAGAPITDS